MSVICIQYDNQAAVHRAYGIMCNGKSHHIHRRHNTMRHLLNNEIISINFVKFKDNIVDLFISEESITCIDTNFKFYSTNIENRQFFSSS